MMRQKIILTAFVFLPVLLVAQKSLQQTTEVQIKIIEEGNHQITPAMVCITGAKDGKVRVPPYALIPDTVSAPEIFYTGIDYKKDKNWIGPIRKTNGLGNEDNRSSCYDMLPSIPYWKEPVMYQTSGDFTIKMPIGKWHISIEHGNEFIPIQGDIVVTGKEAQLSRTFVFKRWINLPELGWYSGDVHVHHPTTKQQFKDYLLEYAKAEDVHLVNVLEMGDHVRTDFKQEGFGEKFRLCKDNICLVSGQEEPRSDFGHVIGLNIDHLTRDTSTYNYYDLVFQKLHLQPGAIVGFAHFAFNGSKIERGLPMYLATGQVDFVELLQFSKINTLDYYDYLNLGFRITAAAGSDMPWGSTLGEVRTFVYTGKNFSADDWFSGLKAGHTFVSNGPALFLDVDGKLPGSEIEKNSGSKIVINAKAVSHPGVGIIKRIAIYNNDGLVTEKINKEKSNAVEINLTHVLKKSQWIAAVTYSDNGAVAHTTPVYVVIDGRSTFDEQKGPTIIDKQMGLMQKVEDEEKAKKPVDAGILQRIAKGREFYKNLLKEMNAKP